MVKKKHILNEIDDIENFDREIVLHENPFVIFVIYKNDIFMTFKANDYKLSLKDIIKAFIKDNEKSTDQELINEVEFKRADITNMESFSKYSYDAIRFAFASFFYDLSDLVERKIIKDSSVNFKNSHITNKYEFIFKNLGINLKSVKIEEEIIKYFDFSKATTEEISEIKKIYKDAGINFNLNKKTRKKKQPKEKVKYFTIPKSLNKKTFYILKMKPRNSMLNPGGKLGRIKKYNGKGYGKIFSDFDFNVRFFILTKKSYLYLEKIILNNKNKKIDKFKLHIDPEVYFDEYYDSVEILSDKLFSYSFYELNYKDIKKIQFMEPDKTLTYKK